MIEIDLDDRLAETATEYGIRDITRSVFYGPDYDRQYTVDSHFKPCKINCLKWPLFKYNFENHGLTNLNGFEILQKVIKNKTFSVIF